MFHLLAILSLAFLVMGGNGSSDRYFFISLEQPGKSDEQLPVEYPIFNHYPPNNKYLKNEPQTLRLVQNWIAGFRPGGTTLPSRALQMAIAMEPDAIFLLSDGELRDDSIWMLRNVNRDLQTGKARILIQTILFMSDYGRFTLETIAHENRGEFRSITSEQWLAARNR